MLKSIIAKFLHITEEQSQTLIDLISLESHWQEKLSWNDITSTPHEIKTQADLIKFLQCLGQTHWFKGHDRSKLPHNQSGETDKYFGIFEQLGLFQTATYPATESNQPHYAVVLGSSESAVIKRVHALANDLRNGLMPKAIFGLGCNRQLGVSVPTSEEDSKTRLLAAGKNTTEMEMVNLVTEAALEQLKNENPAFISPPYHRISTLSTAKDRTENNCAKTADTAKSLKGTIESLLGFAELPKPINIVIYSDQPYIERQRRDVKQQLGDNYRVIGVGQGVTREHFNASPISINAALGEIARLINISFNHTEKCLEQYKTPLTTEELQELAALQNNLAIALTKMNDLAALQKADTLLIQSHSEAIKNHEFVTPYYLADVNIKLATFCVTGSTEFLRHIKLAHDYMTDASNALRNNQCYTQDYINKSASRIYQLLSDTQAVCNDLESAKRHEENALRIRELVPAMASKTEQPKQREDNLSGGEFNQSMLFCQSMVTMTVDEVAHNEKNRRRI